MKLAVLGGSFDPPHVGHLHLADTALASLGYDRIILVPAYQSPFKTGDQGSSARDRFDMLLASIAGDPRITVDDCEIKRGGVSYTIDTLEDIASRYRPEGKLGLVLGDDLVQGFSEWRRVEDIIARADIIIARRTSSEALPFPYPCVQLENSILNISSGTVRDAIRGGKSWRYLVSEGSRHIIEDRGLYGFRPAEKTEGEEKVLGPKSSSPEEPQTPPLEKPETFPSWGFIAKMENETRAMVGTSRFFHSRGTALLSYDLALRFWEDPAKAYLAGITHDIAKELPEEELRALAKFDEGGISKEDLGKTSLLHPKAGAVILREKFNIQDGEVLEAVREHTLGRLGMGNLAKIVYVADKTEVTRKGIPAELRDVDRYEDLDSLFLAVVENTVDYLSSKKYSVSKNTLRLLRGLKKQEDQ